MRLRQFLIGLPVFFIAGLLAASIGCSTYRAKTTYIPPVDDTKTNVTESTDLVSQLSTEIRFRRNSAMLTPSAIEALNIFLSRAVSSKNVSDVKVIAWSDKDYPTPKKAQLSDRDRDLAEKRGRVVEDYLSTHIPKGKVEVFNMADRPNYLDRLFRTSDYRLKQALESAGLTGRTAADQPTNGRASQAVVLAVVERD